MEDWEGEGAGVGNNHPSLSSIQKLVTGMAKQANATTDRALKGPLFRSIRLSRSIISTFASSIHTFSVFVFRFMSEIVAVHGGKMQWEGLS